MFVEKMLKKLVPCKLEGVDVGRREG